MAGRQFCLTVSPLTWLRCPAFSGQAQASSPATTGDCMCACPGRQMQQASDTGKTCRFAMFAAWWMYASRQSIS